MSRLSFVRRPRLSSRQLHRLGAILISLPALVAIGTGVLLQLKKSWAWVQPATQRGSDSVPQLDFAAILDVARTVPKAEIADWRDIDRLDVRPARGVVKVRANNHWEIQIDTATGDVLQVAYRRSDVIEALHDGSWFHDAARLWIFLPNGVVLLVLWVTGVYLWFLPVIRRRRARRGP